MSDAINVVTGIKTKLKELPGNTMLDKGTAPVERWEGIKEASRDIKRHVLHVMSSKNPVDMATISDVSDEFHELEEAFSKSIPVYPNPWDQVDKLKEQVREGGYGVTAYKIYYYSGSMNDDRLVTYRDASPSSWEPRIDSDPLGDLVRSFVKGYENIERFVVDGLKNSSTTLSGQKALNKAEEMFHEQEKNISYVCAKESVVKDKGIFVDWSFWHKKESRIP